MPIDLGLSVKWANTNSQAADETKPGLYVSWGETKSKLWYLPNTYAYDGLSCSELEKKGIIEKGGILTDMADAATTALGKGWRIPTFREWAELIEKCTWTVTTKNNIEGCQVKGPNGNSIFIPALGFAVQNSHQNIGQIGAYWSKNIDASDDDKDWGANCMIVAPGDPNVKQRIVAFDAYVGVWYAQ